MPLANVLAPQLVVKQEAESRLCAMDFTKYPEIADNAETLTGTPTVTAALVSGTVTTAPTIGSPTISGSQVRFRISAGVRAAGVQEAVYRYEVRVETSGGNTLEGDGLLYLTD